MDISIIIPSFNALGKLERCLTSLRHQTMDASRYEVIFVDDCSTDGTFAYLQQQAAHEPNWRVLQLPQNSGSPSRPRNMGTNAARGEYVFFLDCDDEIIADTLEVHLAHAQKTNACIVRGYLIADDGQHQRIYNRLDGWKREFNRAQKIEMILGHQSTIPCSLIKRSLFSDTVSWPEDLRMGEDTVFLASVLSQAKVVEYIEHPTYIYNQRASFTASSTQSYGARELKNHLAVWRRVQAMCMEVGVDYFRCRLQKGLQSVFKSLVFRNRYDISKALFLEFASFIRENHSLICTFDYIERFKDIIQCLLSSNFEKFSALTRPRLLIAGYDLKFINPAIQQLSQFFEIQVDEWSGHNSHNEQSSRQKLQWADYIWCEWLLGNAVWYSKNKLKHQKLVIRMHRFELGRDFGEQLDIDNVDAITTVSVLFFERLIERFPNIPRNKVRLLPNFVDASGYRQVDVAASKYNLAMIGFVPAKKGFADALRLLRALRRHDSRYNLTLFGKAPSDLPWLKNHLDELEYFEECSRFIASEGLADAVSYAGFCDIKSALAEKNIGFVLSMSEAVRDLPGFESFHIAIIDAYAAGAIGLVRYWTGCEYVYPRDIIYPDESSLLQKIVNFDHNTVDKSSKGWFEPLSLTHFIKSFRDCYV